MTFSFRSDIRRIGRSIDQGLLTEACKEFRRGRLKQTPQGDRLADRLVTHLIMRARRKWISGELPQAWQDLSDAASISHGSQFDQIASEKTQLVDKTIDLASQLLNAGKAAEAERTLDLLRARRILDRRADYIHQVAKLIVDADDKANKGQFKSAKELLEQALAIRPELDFIQTRIQSCASQQEKMKGLTSELQQAINESAWSGARNVSRQMLQIAPEHQVALDAQSRCDHKDIQFIENNIRDTQQSSKQNTAYDENRVDQFAALDELAAAKSVVHDTQVAESPIRIDDPATEVAIISEGEQSVEDKIRISSNGQNQSFMLWIDGVGGYLVCTANEVLIGQAIPRSGVDIPLQADIRRQHLKIKRMDDAYLVEPIGDVQINDRDVDSLSLIRDEEILSLGHGVQLKFRQTGALGRSAKIEFTSRHRTEPWSDAVFLMGDALVLGNDANCHIVCPDWDEKMVLFWDRDHLVFRGPDAIEINGKNHAGDAILQPDMRISGENFAITVETIT